MNKKDGVAYDSWNFWAYGIRAIIYFCNTFAIKVLAFATVLK